MSNKVHRIVVTVPEEMERDIALIKRRLFYDKTYAQLCRQAIRLGLESLDTEKAADGGSAGA